LSRPPASRDPIDAQRFQLVADTLPALLAYLDEEARYVWVNGAYQRWFARSPESICGRQAREIVGEAAWGAVEHHVARALAGEEVSYEARIDFGPGHTRDVTVSYVPDRDASGRVRGFVSLVTDISDTQNAERALRESERMLAESQTAANLGSWEARLNEDGPPDALRWSEGMYRIFGHLPGSAIDYGIFISSIHPDDRALVRNSSRAGIERGGRFEKEYRIVRPDGAVRMLHSWVTVERDAAGRAAYLRGTCQDITERKLAETEIRLAREHLQVVVDTTPALIARYDRDLRIVWANKNYAGRFGKQPEEVVGKSLLEIVGPDAFAVLEPATVRVLAGEPIDLEMEVAYLTGPRWMHFVVSPTFGPAGAVNGCVAVITDNTHLRKLEIERARALAELREADRRKDEFLAMLSHELRNPMAPILTAVEILRLAPTDAKTSAGARAVIERQVTHLKRLLDDLLDVSRVSQGKIELRRERLDLGTVLQLAIEVSQPLMAQRDQRLSVTSARAAILVDADPARLVQVFGNLLNNAAKYSEPGGAIEVSMVVEDREAVVRVRDQGVGMTPDLIERAFDLFAQDTRSLDRAQGGIGIGLTMVRSLVKLHGGSVQAFSDGPGLGCEIVVRLPRASEGTQESSNDPPARRDQPAPVIAPSPRPLRLLVVDDNVDAATTLATLLRLLGHEVAVAHDGPGALATAARTRPELVFIDIGLPGMDGYALATALRAAGLDRAALVAVTGYGRAEDVQRSRALGFDRHIVKPVDLAELQHVTALRRCGQDGQDG
jgi:PAS domain S-box-containing protein